MIEAKGHFHICVVGGGPAGAVAARALVGAGARVMLVARNQPNAAFGVGETVPAEVQPLLKHLGLDCLTADLHLASAGTMMRWGSDVIRFREAILNPYGSGWHIDRLLFEQQLIAAAVSKGATVVEKCTKIRTGPTRTGWEFQIERAGHEFCVASNYVLDCTGRTARLALELGARRQIHDKLIAIWCVVEALNGRQDLDKRIYIESVQNGWLYSAQIPRRRRVIVYFTDGDLCDIPRMRLPLAFQEFVANSFHLETITDGLQHKTIAGPFCVSAASTRLICAHGARWVAAGDAAQSFDPLSSQGIMSAIVAGNNAAAALVSSHSSGRWAMDEFQTGLDNKYTTYLAERRTHYLAEQRWKEHPFWRRRHESRQVQVPNSHLPLFS
jgi:flavin-dependent dehydrogenase